MTITIDMDNIYALVNTKYELKEMLHYMEFVMEVDISTFRFQLFRLPNKNMVEIFS
jgi:hypothetical protein